MLTFKLICLKTDRITTLDLPDTSICLSVQHTTWFHLPHLHYQSHFIVVVQSMEPNTYNSSSEVLPHVQSINRRYKDLIHITSPSRTKYYCFSLTARLFQMRHVDVQCQSVFRNIDIINQTINSTVSKML